MRKEWISPDLFDLTVRATERGGQGGFGEHSPEEFHRSSSDEGEDFFGGGGKHDKPGKPDNSKGPSQEFWGNGCGFGR